MSKIRKIIILLILIVAVVFSIKNYFINKSEVIEVRASMFDNVRGFAWSSNIGWISFNSVNCDVDGDGTYEGNNEGNPIGSTPAPLQCPTLGVVSPYGVSLSTADGTGKRYLSGYAWSENIGWIIFKQAILGDPDYTCPSLNCFGAECASTPLSACSPTLTDQNKFVGWARACSVFQNGCSGPLRPASELGGWDGWIGLSKCDFMNPLCANSWEAFFGWNGNVLLAPPNNEFSGYAWGGINVGWISFNSINCTTNIPMGPRPAGCPAGPMPLIPRYRVYVEDIPPQVNNLTVVNNTSCVNRFYTLDWDFIDPGDTQSKYQIQIYNDLNFILANLKFDSGEVASSTSSATVSMPTEIAYGSTYYWQVKVWDSAVPTPNSSNWFAYSDNVDPKESFTTITSDYYPTLPATITAVTTINQGDTVAFDVSGSSCASPPGCSAYTINFGDGPDVSLPFPPPLSNLQPSHTYTIFGSIVVRLDVTGNGETCTKNYNFMVNSKPKWNEIAPE